VHPWIVAACSDESGVNVQTYVALDSCLTLVQLIDILEMKAIRASWSHAEMLNAEWNRKIDERNRAVLGV